MNAPCQRPRMLEGRPPARPGRERRSPASLRLEEAEGVFRDLASQMRAFAQNEILAVWIVKLLRYDPVMASAGLIGMSNSLATYGRCGRQHRGRCSGGGVGIRENTQLLTGRARMAVQIEQTGGPPCRRLKKEIRKKRNQRRTRTSLRPMCRLTRRHKARASRPSTRSRERPEARFGCKVEGGRFAAKPAI